MNIPSSTRKEICYEVHAEQNVITMATRLGVSIA